MKSVIFLGGMAKEGPESESMRDEENLLTQLRERSRDLLRKQKGAKQSTRWYPLRAFLSLLKKKTGCSNERWLVSTPLSHFLQTSSTLSFHHAQESAPHPSHRTASTVAPPKRSQWSRIWIGRRWTFRTHSAFTDARSPAPTLPSFPGGHRCPIR